MKYTLDFNKLEVNLDVCFLLSFFNRKNGELNMVATAQMKFASEVRPRYCSVTRYIIHLYCLAVQAGFYSDVVEC